MSHLLSSVEASPCMHRGAAIAAAAVAFIAVVTSAQLLTSGPPELSATRAPLSAEDNDPEDGTASFPPGAPSETAELVQRTGESLRGGLTPSVRAFADDLYIGIAVWEILPQQKMAQWRIVFANTAATPMIGKDMDACVGHTVYGCFPELDNDAGHRYGALAELALVSGRTIHVGATWFAQTNGIRRLYYTAITGVDSSHVAVLYHVLGDSPSVEGAHFGLGLDLPADLAVDVQLRVLSDVATALDHKLSHAGSDDARD